MPSRPRHPLPPVLPRRPPRTSVWSLRVASRAGRSPAPRRVSCGWRDASTDNAARTALAQGEYARVIEVYQPLIAVGKPLSDVAHYRLAIAGSRLGLALDAWNHLSAALTLNSQGTFATSPSRLADLRTTILTGCEKQGMPQCKEALAVPGATHEPTAFPAAAVVGETGAVAAPAAAASALALPASAAAFQPGSELALSPVHAEPAAAPTAHEAPAESGKETAVLQISLQGLLLLQVGWIACRVYLRDRRMPAGIVGVEALRENVASFLHRLSSAGGQNTLLYRHLDALLPLLEREAGRTLYRATGKAQRLVDEDRKSVELTARLTAAPLDVLHASAQDIQALFQRPAV